MALFESLLKPLFSKVFVLIYADSSTCWVNTLRFKKSKLVDKTSKEFKIPSKIVSTEVLKYVKKIKNKYTFCYVGALSNMPQQGVFGRDFVRPKKDTFLENIKDFEIIKSKDFGAFIHKHDLKLFLQNYNSLNGLDYVFSPFLVLHKVIESRLDSTLKIYVLCEKTNLTILIANHDGIYYGNYVDLMNYYKETEKEELTENDQESSKTQEVEVSKSNNDDSSISDLDDGFYEDSDFDDEIEDLDLEIVQKEDPLSKEQQESKDQVKILSEIFQNTFREFYDLGGDFIEEIMIFDTTDISHENLSLIRNSMLMDIYREEINLKHQLLLLMISEYKAENAV